MGLVAGNGTVGLRMRVLPASTAVKYEIVLHGSKP